MNEAVINAPTYESVGLLERIRQAELQIIAARIPHGARVLEIGGGSGYQAAVLAGSGYELTSIDLAGRRPRPKQFAPVLDYDGVHIPAPDRSFEVVFSSNVIEHVKHLPELLADMRRVIIPGGRLIHVMPSASWRFWTSLALYLYVMKRLLGLRASVPGETSDMTVSESVKKKRLGTVLRGLIWQKPHGVHSSAAAELYWFSRRRWKREFQRCGFQIVEARGNALFYTGYGLFPWLSISARRRLSRLLGSSCHVFVLKAAEALERDK